MIPPAGPGGTEASLGGTVLGATGPGLTGPAVLRASLWLLMAGLLAQALPLLLGPWITRLYSPAEFGLFQLLAVVAANVAVVGCARYEFALPLAQEPNQAQALGALCRWLLLLSTTLAALLGLGWAFLSGASWPLWLPAWVLALSLLSLATLGATRSQRFKALAAARVLQHGGGAVLQVAAGTVGAGLGGLIAGAMLATLASTAMLWQRLPQWWRIGADRLRQSASRYRDFPVLNTPHAFAGALQDTLSVALIAAWLGPAAAGFWGLTLRYVKAPATLVGMAVSQALYPALAASGATQQSRQLLRRLLLLLGLIAGLLVLLLSTLAPAGFAWAFGQPWRPAGDLAQALALYIGLHFVASPLSVVTMAWNAQAWALKLALVGQVAFVAALALGLWLGGLNGAGWAVSLVMALYFAYFFWRLWFWPLAPTVAAP